MSGLTAKVCDGNFAHIQQKKGNKRKGGIKTIFLHHDGAAPWLVAGPRRHIRNVNIKRATFHKKFKSSH